MHKNLFKACLLNVLLAGACRSVESPPPVPKTPTIEFVGFEASSRGKRELPIFRLVNQTQQPFTYSRQDGSPVYFIFDLGNPSRADGILMCGTGITEQTLDPGDSIRLGAWHRKEALGPIQVRISVRNATDQNFALMSEPVGIAADRISASSLR